MTENNHNNWIQSALWIPVLMIAGTIGAVTMGASPLPNIQEDFVECVEFFSTMENFASETDPNLVLMSYRPIEIIDGEWLKYYPVPNMKKKDGHKIHVPSHVMWRIIPL